MDYIPTPRPELKALRLKHGLTQNNLAAILGCDVFRVQAWEQGRNKPRLRYQIALATLFGLSLEELQRRIGLSQSEAIGNLGGQA